MIAPNHKGLRDTLPIAITLITGCAIALSQVAGAEQPKADKLVVVSKDVSLRVIEAGPAEAQTIVLVPGWCFTADIWSKQIAVLGDRYHVVAFDPRSQGRSTILDHSNSPDDRATDIANLIKTMHLRKPVLVGWSQGVQDVAAYALAFGTDEVAGLVFVDAPVSAGAAGLNTQMAAATLGRMPMYAGSPRDYLEVMMTYLFKQPLSPSELTAIVDAALKTPSSIGVANLTLDLFGKDYRKAFSRISVPALVVVAGTAPDKSGQLQQAIPNLTSAVVDNAGHAVFYDEPGKFNELLARFLEERVKAKGGA